MNFLHSSQSASSAAGEVAMLRPPQTYTSTTTIPGAPASPTGTLTTADASRRPGVGDGHDRARAVDVGRLVVADQHLDIVRAAVERHHVDHGYARTYGRAGVGRD